MKSKFNLILGLLGALSTLVCAWRMYTLNQQQELWAYLPLVVLLGIWAVVVAFKQKPERFYFLAVATVAGVSLGLGFPPLPTWPLIAFGFAAMLYLTEHLFKADLKLKQQWWYAYHALLLYNIIASWWVANTSFAAGFVANYFNAFFMTLPWLAIFASRKFFPKIWIPIAVIFWIGFEFMHYNWQIAWPWLSFGNGMSSTTSLVQWYEYTGIFGGSLYLLVAGALLFACLNAKLYNAPFRNFGIALVLWILVPMGISLSIGSNIDLKATSTKTISAIQPNYEPHYSKFTVSQEEQLAHFMSLVKQAPASDLVVFPETSFGSYNEKTLGQSVLMRRWKSKDLNMNLLAGLSTYRQFSSAIDNPALRTIDDVRGKRYYISYNTAISYERLHDIDIYHKSKLVPGVEFLPYREVFFIFNPLVKSLGGTTAGLGTNDSAQVFRYSNGINAAPLICYESIYGNYVREFVQAGANLLVVPTNDGWWDNTPGHVQHLQMAQLRAIETRRSVVQAANTGVSAIIDAKGHVKSSTQYNEATYLSGEVDLYTGDTFYVRWGDQIGRLGFGLSILLLVALLSRVWRGRVGKL